MNAKVYGASVVTERKQLHWPKPKRVGDARATERFIKLFYRLTEIIDGAAFYPNQPISRAEASIADPRIDIAKHLRELEAESSLCRLDLVPRHAWEEFWRVLIRHARQRSARPHTA